MNSPLAFSVGSLTFKLSVGPRQGGEKIGEEKSSPLDALSCYELAEIAANAFRVFGWLHPAFQLGQRMSKQEAGLWPRETGEIDFKTRPRLLKA